MPEFFTEEEFEVLKSLSGQKNENTEEHKQGYQILKKAYQKLEYWLSNVSKETFNDGKTKILKRPTNQANYFDGYLWCQLYPNEDYKNYWKIAFTLGLDAKYGFNVKIDTVHLKEDDPTRIFYLKRRGDFLNSSIVKFKSFIEVQEWSELIKFGVDVINSLKDEYYDLIEKVKPFDERAKRWIKYPFKYLNMNHPLNQILFGPPGTGKTYNTISRALSIIENKAIVELEKEKREAIKSRYSMYVESGQIVFTTFHQSFSYEDFVEGIKPVMDSENADVKYEIRPGIFKRICVEASFSLANENKSDQTEAILDFSLAFEKFVEILEERMTSDDEVSITTKNGGKLIVDSISSQRNIIVKHPRGENTYTISKNRLSKLHKAFPDLSKVHNIDSQFREVIGGSNSTANWAVLNSIREEISSLEEGEKQREVTWEEKYEVVSELKNEDYLKKEGTPHILIVDEINRGNISQIFGELITLLESDKRLGADEAIIVQLPYSQDSFGVPPNLFIIGTMNTADRSVEALDTALRRRFTFNEIAPQPHLLAPDKMLWSLWEKDWDYNWDDKRWINHEREILDLLGGKILNKDDYFKLEKLTDWGEGRRRNVFEGIVQFDGIDIQLLLTAMNQRIELLIDKDHMIGHSYFYSLIGSENCEKELLSIFYDKIIPLLEEYFYGDFGKIGLVFGSHFVETKVGKKVSFADFKMEDQSIFQEKNIYHIIDYRRAGIVHELSFLEAVRSIYNPGHPVSSNE